MLRLSSYVFDERACIDVFIVWNRCTLYNICLIVFMDLLLIVFMYYTFFCHIHDIWLFAILPQ